MKHSTHKKWYYRLLTFLSVYSGIAISQVNTTPALVDFDAYENLVSEVKQHRRTHLLTAEQFLKTSKEQKVIILDTRSDSMYTAAHIKGAIHLNFSDFTQTNLARIIPSADYKILIYCNNNIKNQNTFPVNAERLFATKAFFPAKFTNPPKGAKPITLALNIPTYINLYGYGYRNIYELSELIDASTTPLEFEGTEVAK